VRGAGARPAGVAGPSTDQGPLSFDRGRAPRHSKAYGAAVDWYALGVLIYEMLAGYTPFADDDHVKLYEKILANKPRFPAHFDPDAKDLCKRLMTADLSRRYGNLRNGSKDIRNHKWCVPRGARVGRRAVAALAHRRARPRVTRRAACRRFEGIDWKKVAARKLTPPYIPKVKDDGDTSNFDDYPEDKDLIGPPGPDPYAATFANF